MARTKWRHLVGISIFSFPGQAQRRAFHVCQYNVCHVSQDVEEVTLPSMNVVTSHRAIPRDFITHSEILSPEIIMGKSLQRESHCKKPLSLTQMPREGA